MNSKSLSLILVLTLMGWLSYVDAADWPRFLGPNSDGIVTEKGLLTDWPAAGLKKLWSAPLGDGGGGIHAGPAVANGKVFIPGRTGPNDVIYCLDAVTGKEAWQYSYAAPGKMGWGSGSRSTPTVANGHVYALGAFGHLVCLQVADGKKVWMRNLIKDFAGKKPHFGMTASPCVEGDLVICEPGGAGASVVALNAKTGKTVWKSGSDKAAYAIPQVVTIAGVKQVLAFPASGLVALDLKTGKELWRFAHKDRQGKSVAAPIVVGDRIFVANRSGGFVALQISNKGGKWSSKTLWKTPKVRMHFSQPVLGTDSIYFHDGRGKLCCLALADGKVAWKAPNMDKQQAMPIRIGTDHLILTLGSGEVVLLQVSSKAFKEKARFSAVGKNAFAYPAVADGKLYVRDYKQVVCFDLKAK